MARRRMIDPAIWDSEQVQSLAGDDFKLYIYTISNADDEGRMPVSAPMLRSKVFPLREDILARGVADMVNRLAAVGLVDLYEDGFGVYLSHPNWLRYQTIDRPKPSRLPDPGACTPLQQIGEQSPINRRRVDEPSENHREHVVHKGKESKRREVRRSENDLDEPDHSHSASEIDSESDAGASSPEGSPPRTSGTPPELQVAVKKLARSASIRAGPPAATEEN